MFLKSKQAFKKFISTPLLKNIKNDFMSKKDDFEKFYRYEVEIKNVPDDFDPITWLIGQDNQIKTYWSNRNKSFCIAGIGYTDIFSDISGNNSETYHFIQDMFQVMKTRISSTDKPVRYFGCLAFDIEDRIDPLWHSFGKVYFIVPKVELYRLKKKVYLACNIFYDPLCNKSKKDFYDEMHDFLEIIQTERNLPEEKNIKFINRRDIPEKEEWKRNINQAISGFDFEGIKKIVLARKSIFKLLKNIDPVLFLSLIRKINIKTYDFCFQNERNNAFIGCTPELLFSREDSRILSETIAGTRLRGKNAKEEKEFGEDLLKSKKDSEEYQFVFDSIKNDLGKICSNAKVTKKKEILKLSYVQHIYSQFKGNLKSNIDDFAIISAIHPTPAVLGYPKKNIKSIIKRYETFFRGFYAGPVGWVGKDSSEFAVGIRSGVINDGSLSIYSGAGIVKKSVPELEWIEIENKISPFLKIMQNRRI